MKKLVTAITLVILVLAAAAAIALLPRTAAEPEPTPTPTAAPTPTPTPTPEPTPEPTPTPTPEPEPEYFTLSFVGDCTLASSQHHKGLSVAFENVVGDDYAYPFAATAQYFADDYLSAANLESVFTTAEQSSGATFVFKSDPALAQILPAGGIEFVTLANNHANDYLEQGKADTRAALDAVGVAYAGDGESYLYQSGDGPTVGIYCALYPELGSTETVTTAIAALREAGADIVVFAPHWGLEGSYQVTAGQETLGRAAIDAGADIVYGCHPHVLQRAESYNGGWILYSLGNWSFGGNTAPRDRDTAIAQATFRRDPDGSITLDSTALIPCKLSGADAYNDYQPQPLEEGSEAYDRAMSKLDGTFAGPDLSIDYSAFH